ncbi:MAG: GAF domain-containing protein [Deltaproteobacteria bacterium]|nr:GAF domain-containing protein [Deltaproteobacteria bacterium]
MVEDKKEWAQFFKQMFKEGEKFTEDLLKENERLRQRNAFLEHELSLRSASGRSDSSQLLTRLEVLEEERNRLKEELSSLKRRLKQVEKENADFTLQYLEIEKQNSNFASLYVASYQLHSTIDFNKILKVISDILTNLIGAEYFGIYLYDPRSSTLVLTSVEGLDEPKGSRVELRDNLMSRVASSGELYIDPEIPEPGNYARPIALQPLISSGDLVGMLAIHKLLVQKEGFEPIDMELFSLLGAHAGTALLAARICSEVQAAGT